MFKKLIQKDVEKFFKENSCKLLDKYINIKSKVKYLAQCGHENCISFDNFKSGKGILCNKCSRERGGTNRILSQNKVKQYFLENKCKLLSRYINSRSKVDYLAQCGHKNTIIVDSFKAGCGKLCKKCAIESGINKKKLKYLDVEKYFKIRGCILLKQIYKNVKTPLKYIATCGHLSVINFNMFKTGGGLLCKKCSIKKQTSEKKYSISYVYNYFKKERCILLEEVYVNNRIKIKYIAMCGHENKISFNDFKNKKTGRKCPKCAHPKKEDHYNWNLNLTDKERFNKRKSPKDYIWRKEVFARDNYTCQMTGKKSKSDIVAHHLKPYHKYKKLRFEVSNGITLNKEFHTFCHKTFGYRTEIGMNKLEKAKLMWENVQ